MDWFHQPARVVIAEEGWPSRHIGFAPIKVTSPDKKEILSIL
jgi:hypothetical protein